MDQVTPKISVCIPVYNGEKYIIEAIDSVLGQNFTDFELIISDNHSTDGTPGILRRFQAQDQRVRCFFNTSNIGPTANFDQCLKHSRGTYVKFLCADDILIGSNCLEKFLLFFDRCPDLALVASARRFIDASSSLLLVVTNYPDCLMAPGGAIIRDCLLEMRNKIGEPTSVMFRRDLAERGFNTDYLQLLDLEMWFHLLRKGTFAYSADPLVGFRVHAEQGTEQNIKSRVHLNDTGKLILDYADTPGYRVGKMVRQYLLYGHCHSIWRSVKKGRIDREFGAGKIREHFNLFAFYLLMPAFKIMKRVMKHYAPELLRAARTN
jgi:glycosyltransferase involved in cell wall biosynthesis